MVALGMGCVTRHRGRHGAGVMDDPRCPSPIAAAGPRLGLGSLGTFGAQGIPTDVALHVSLQLFNRGHADPAGRESAAGSGSPLSHRVTLCPQGLRLGVQGGGRTQGWGCRGCLGANMVLENGTCAPALHQHTGTSAHRGQRRDGVTMALSAGPPRRLGDRSIREMLQPSGCLPTKHGFWSRFPAPGREPGECGQTRLCHGRNWPVSWLRRGAGDSAAVCRGGGGSAGSGR